MFKLFNILNNNFSILPSNLQGANSDEKLSWFDVAKLVLLAAIWGASFILMRLAVPEMGSLFAATCRIVLAAIVLGAFAYSCKIQIHWRLNLKIYALVGVFGAILPFTLFSYASQHLPAAFSALFNATCPLFVALFSILWLYEKVSLRKLAGLVAGILGVLLLVGTGTLLQNKIVVLSVAACLAAPACFAISALVMKQKSCVNSADGKIHPLAMAVGPMVIAAVMLLPTLLFTLPAHTPSSLSISLIILLALIPSALAQLIFIPLLVKIGPTRAMSVAFLIPLFAILWGFIFLQESIQLTSMIGGGIVLLAIGLILKA